MATTRNGGKYARNISIKFWVNTDEKEKIEKRAGSAAAGVWLRALATGDACDDTTFQKRGRISEKNIALAPLVIEMTMVGNHLSQIAEELKARDLPPEQMVSISDQLAQMRKDLHLAVENILDRG